MNKKELERKIIVAYEMGDMLSCKNYRFMLSLTNENEKLKHQLEKYENNLVGNTDSEELQQENIKLKEQLDYIRSGEYYNQLRFENEMLQQVVDTNGIPSEVYDYINCTHRNTELLEEKEQLQQRNDKAIDYIKNNMLYKYKYDEEELFEVITSENAKKDLLKILGEDNDRNN